LVLLHEILTFSMIFWTISASFFAWISFKT
jgi:hypothetical protein